MATAEVEHRRTAMLRAGRLVPITIGCYMSQMALCNKVSGILHDLDKPWRHGQGQHESTNL